MVQVEADARIGGYGVKNRVEVGYIFGAHELEVRGDRTLLQIERGCARLVVSVPSEETSRGGMGGSRHAFSTSCGFARLPALVFDEGTTVYWPGGEEAGELTESVLYYSTSEEDGEMICRDTSLMFYVPEDVAASKAERDVAYCVRREDGRFSE